MFLSKDNINQYSVWLEIARTTGAFALIDKDHNWTSFDVIAKLRRITGIKKIGHAGTLDPLATGLLIVGFGKATKKLIGFQNLDKTYRATIKIGATTKSDDSEYEEENFQDISDISNIRIIEVVNSFKGTIKQVPPNFSAKQINGRRLYRLARKEKKIDILPKEVTIHSIEIIRIDLPYIEILIDCSKGTYIRSIARDIGKELSVGAYLFKLRRLRIGDFNVENALKIENFYEIMS